MKRYYCNPCVDIQAFQADNHLCAASSTPDTIGISSQTIDPGTIGD